MNGAVIGREKRALEAKKTSHAKKKYERRKKRTTQKDKMERFQNAKR